MMGLPDRKMDNPSLAVKIKLESDLTLPPLEKEFVISKYGDQENTGDANNVKTQETVAKWARHCLESHHPWLLSLAKEAGNAVELIYEDGFKTEVSVSGTNKKRKAKTPQRIVSLHYVRPKSNGKTTWLDYTKVLWDQLVRQKERHVEDTETTELSINVMSGDQQDKRDIQCQLFIENKNAPDAKIFKSSAIRNYQAPSNSTDTALNSVTLTEPTPNGTRNQEKDVKSPVKTLGRRGAIAQIAGYCNSPPKHSAAERYEQRLTPMDEITHTPYDGDSNSEVGEVLFDDMKRLLKHKEGGRRRKEATDEANQKLGKELAQSMVTARDLINQANMLYSLDWKDGKIRGTSFGFLTPAQLLVCLHGYKLGGIAADQRLLAQIESDLGVFSLVKEAMERWKLATNYVNLNHCNGDYVFQDSKSDCLKCSIFVARAYSVFKLLKCATLEDSLMGKVKACLEIMDSNVPLAPIEESPKVADETAEDSLSFGEGDSMSQASDGSVVGHKGSGSRKHVPHPVTFIEKVCMDTGVVLGKYRDIAVASRASKTKRELIKRALSGESFIGQKFLWRYRYKKLRASEEEGEENASEKSGSSEMDDGSSISDDHSDVEVDGDSIGSGIDEDVAMDLDEDFEQVVPIEDIDPKYRYAKLVDEAELEGRGDEWFESTPYPFNTSPYEESENAEKGEKLFEEWKMWMESGNHQLEAALGKSMAGQICWIAKQIAMSDNVFKSEWKDGKVQGMVKFLPKPLLLLCLRDEKFSKVDENDKVFGRIVQDLGLSDIVDEAIVTWGLACDFKYLKDASLTFTSNKAQCQKCAIFVSRTFRAMKALHRTTMNLSLFRKVKYCLEIMNENRANARAAKEGSPQSDDLSRSVEGTPPDAIAGRRESPLSYQGAESDRPKKIRKSIPCSLLNTEVRLQPCETNEVLEEGQRRVTELSKQASLLNTYPSGGHNQVTTFSRGNEDTYKELSKIGNGSSLPPGLNKKWARIEQMDFVRKCPYEKDSSAEVGERVFDEMKRLLMPRDPAAPIRRLEATSEAVNAFGLHRATSMVLASSQIALSGMLYSSAWLDGRIRGVDCGNLDESMLLLCLQDQRFHKICGKEAVFAQMIRELDLCEIVRVAIKTWGLQSRYPGLLSCSKNFIFDSQRSQCQRCEIFVARAYCCVTTLNAGIDDSLAGKVMSCLRTMENNVRAYMRPKNNSKRPLGTHTQNVTKLNPPKFIDKNNQENVEPVVVSTSGRPLKTIETPDSQARTSIQNHIGCRNILESSHSDAPSIPSQVTASPIPGDVMITNIRGDQDVDLLRCAASSSKLSTTELLSNPSKNESAQRETRKDLLCSPRNQSPGRKSLEVDNVADVPSCEGRQDSNPSIGHASLPVESYDARIDRLLNGVEAVPTDAPWLPDASEERYLNAIENEMAWLCEENNYCLRQDVIEWRFIRKYASPELATELEKQDGPDLQLERIVRLNDPFVQRRFDVISKKIRREMRLGIFRPKFHKVIREIRKASKNKTRKAFSSCEEFQKRTEKMFPPKK